jgi:hypothetical protein
MTTADAVAAFVADNPGCHLTDITGHFDFDSARAWELLVEAEHRGLLRAVRDGDTGPWHFYKSGDK